MKNPRVVNIKKERIKNIKDYVYVGRGSPFGNPYKIGPDGTRKEVIAKFDKRLQRLPKLIARIKKELKGKNLGCYCAPKKCHADILLKIANAKT